MTDVQIPPEWAAREFCRRLGEDYTSFAAGKISSGIARAIRLGAGLIAEHEEQPVDPLLVEARDFLMAYKGPSLHHDLNDYRDGDRDDSNEMRLVVTALRRGMELARAKDGDES